jgi:hypothetical protein
LLAALIGVAAGVRMERWRAAQDVQLGPAVLNEEVAKHAKPLCRACHGRGVRWTAGHERLCDCASSRFEGRYKNLVVLGPGGLHWIAREKEREHG